MSTASDFLNHNFYFVFYPELGGGHHLRNLISLDRSFFPLGAINHDILYQNLLSWYNDPTAIKAHALPVVGSNNAHTLINPTEFEQYLDSIDFAQYKNSTHPCHATEIYRNDIQNLKNRSMLILTVKDSISYDIINERAEKRYGQHLLTKTSGDLNVEHPGYTFEKFVYSREAAMKHLGIADHRVFEIEVRDFYKQDITPIINNINKFYNLNISLDQAQELHKLWQTMLWR